jgi:hypothetical protein
VIFTRTSFLQEEAGWKGKDNLMKTNTTLIICPASLMAQWENEIKAKVSTVLESSPYQQCCGSGFNGVPGSVNRIRIANQDLGGQKWISKLQFLIPKKKKNFSFIFFFFFSAIKPGSRLDPHTDPDSLEIIESGSTTLPSS